MAKKVNLFDKDNSKLYPVTSASCVGYGEGTVKDALDSTGLGDYPTFSESTAYSAGNVVNYNGKLYKFTADHAAGAWIGSDAEAWSLTKGIENSVQMYHNNITDTDLEISDDKKNILARFVEGHIETKNFNSAEVKAEQESIRNHVVNLESTVIPTAETESDLEFSDEDGNVLARFSDGHIKTKNFDSSNIQTGGGGGGSFLPRPTNGVVNFSVMVDTYIADNDSNTLNNQDIPISQRSEYIKEDWGVMNLPTNYDPNGKPIRLVIACHGTGTWISSGAISANSYITPLFLGMGIAVMDVNAVPDATSTADRHYGSPLALRSYLAAISYCLKNYNLKKEIFVWGASMGGLISTTLAEIGGINVFAQAAMCPCIDVFREAYAIPWNGAAQRKAITQKFGFSKGTPPTSYTTTRPVPADEKAYFLANINKVIGYNSMWRNTIGMDFEECINVDVPNDISSETSEEKALFENVTKIRNVPVKIWHNEDDPTVPFKYSKYFIEMCRRGGCLAELRPFPSGGHNAWDNGETLQIETLYSGSINVSVSVYEVYCWFKRFDNN